MMTRDDVPRHLLPLYDRAMSGKRREAAILAHCAMCMGWDRAAVGECTATGCPLFPYRLSARAQRRVRGDRSGAESTQMGDRVPTDAVSPSDLAAPQSSDLRAGK